MTGREVIITNRSFSPQELYEFMEEHWDKEQYNDFILGSPTDMTAGLYVMLPATSRHLVIVYSRDKGFLSKDKKVILSVAMTTAGAAEAIENNIRRKIVEKVTVNPKYYDKMSAILDKLMQADFSISFDAAKSDSGEVE